MRGTFHAVLQLEIKKNCLQTFRNHSYGHFIWAKNEGTVKLLTQLTLKSKSENLLRFMSWLGGQNWSSF
jgi:hypothetical protein